MGRILVADDDTWILRMVTSVLEKSGHTVVTAEDGAEALQALGEGAFDLVITDVMMPDIDGWTLVKRMRTKPETALVPVIFLSGMDSENDRIRGFRLGADDYIAKPFRFEELDLRVRRTLRTRAVTQNDNTADLHGKLERIGIAPLLTLMDIEKKTGRLTLERGSDEATVWLHEGRVVKAETNQGVVGAECIYGLLEWDHGEFFFSQEAFSGNDAIGIPTQHLLMEGARRIDEKNQPTTIPEFQ